MRKMFGSAYAANVTGSLHHREPLPTKARADAEGRQTTGPELKDRDFDVQELLGILAEITHQQPHIAGQAYEIVVEPRIGEELTCGRGVVIELGGSGFDVCAGVAQLVVKHVVRGQLAKRTFP